MIETKEVAPNLIEVLPLNRPKTGLFLGKNELLSQEAPELDNKKVKKLLPMPEVIYQNKDAGVGNLQNGLEQAFDLLFEATAQKMSTNSN